jgi:hypothetical protein
MHGINVAPDDGAASDLRNEGYGHWPNAAIASWLRVNGGRRGQCARQPARPHRIFKCGFFSEVTGMRSTGKASKIDNSCAPHFWGERKEAKW